MHQIYILDTYTPCMEALRYMRERNSPILQWFPEHSIVKWWLLLAIERITNLECVDRDYPDIDACGYCSFHVVDPLLGRHLPFQLLTYVISAGNFSSYELVLYPTYHGFLILRN